MGIQDIKDRLIPIKFWKSKYIPGIGNLDNTGYNICLIFP